jgi:hypothetical protein
LDWRKEGRPPPDRFNYSEITSLFSFTAKKKGKMKPNVSGLSNVILQTSLEQSESEDCAP